MTLLTRSQPAALLGEAPPRVLVEPRGARANSWEDVADLSLRAGITLDGWQELILQAAMGERTDATWAAKRVGISVPRQNGKSQLLVARALAGVLLFGELKIVISAHQQDTARETFSKMIEILEADGNGWLMDRVKPNGIMNAINREAVKFRNGATIQFKARSGSGGRGFSSDCLLLDEAQRLKRPAWVSINSTMSAMPNPQVWLLGTPPTREDMEAQMGFVFESVREAAVAGTSTATAWAEWGVDKDAPELADVFKAAPRAWTSRVSALCWASNPAWTTRINSEVVQGEFESYTPEEFAQDRLGMWLADFGAKGSRLISKEQWSETGITADAVPQGIKSFGVAYSQDGSRVALAGARKHAGGIHVELLDGLSGNAQEGVGELAEWLADHSDDVAQIVICGAAGATDLAAALRTRGVPQKVIHVASTTDYFASSAALLQAVRDKSLTHLASDGQAALDMSVAVCDKKARGGAGTWGWASTTPDGDETPVEAVGLAHWIAKTTKRRPGQRSRVVVLA